MYSAKPIILTGILILPLLAIFGFFLYKKIQKNNEDQRTEKLIFDSLDYSRLDKSSSSVKSLDELVITFWRDKLKPAGIVSPISDDRRNVMQILLICGAIFIITFLFTMNILIALIPVVIALGGLVVYCNIKISQFERVLNEQIPSFLSALKSNVQSNETPERALVSAIDNTADPLYSELKVVKSLIQTGSFETALGALRRRTKNEYLQFLCSCIELSSEVGTNLEEQIVIIEKMITDKQELTRKTDSAVAENMPILYVTAVAVPFLFVFMYFNDESVRNFWFHSLLSWVLFALIIIVCVIGCFIGSKIIKSVRKL